MLMSRRQIFIAILFFTVGREFSAQSLWQDHNPYAVGSNLRQGTILKLEVDEPVEIVYQYDNLTDENVDIQLVPDRNITSFLPPANSNRSMVKNYKNRLNSRSHMRLHIAVRIDADPKGSIASFQGTKFIGHENGISRQQIQVKGQVHIEDISSGRRIHSRDIADLQLLVTGVPVPRSQGLALPPPQKKQDGQASQAQEGKISSDTPSLSDEQKRQLLWQYINRLLGETSSQ